MNPAEAVSSTAGSEPATNGGALLQFLMSAEAHGHDAGPLQLIETHMSWVVLDAHFALKLKKAVNYPPLYDCRSLAAREQEARAELRLNRRLAPGVYLGLLAVQSDGGEGGPRFVLRPDGSPDRGGWHTVDWLVQMQRLPAELMLDRMIGDGRVQPAHVEALALLLSRFYRHAAPADMTPQDYLGRLHSEQQRNRAVLLQPRFALADAAPALDALDRALQREAQALAQRVRQGRIVDGHGDLRPEHVALIEPPVVIDALTFNDSLRQLDPFEELLGLALECERLGAPWIGPLLLERCAERLDDDPGRPLLQLYAGNRALLRARLAVAHLLDTTPRDGQRWLDRGRLHLRQALQALAEGAG